MNGTLTLGIWVCDLTILSLSLSLKDILSSDACYSLQVAAHTISLAVVIIKIIVINKGNKWKEVRYRKNNEL